MSSSTRIDSCPSHRPAKAASLALAAGMAAVTSASTPIIPVNGSFENGPVFNLDGTSEGHANLPAPWTSPSPGDAFISGDTWSQLGSPVGLHPTSFGVFPSTMIAYDGVRWAGGWDFEYISQPMNTGMMMVAGQDYSISAAVHASHIGSGGSVEISFGNSVNDRSLVAGVLPGFTTLADGWQHKTLTFTATPAMASATWFHFRAYSPTGAPVYMAVDAIPAPGAAMLGLVGGGSLAVLRRRGTR